MSKRAPNTLNSPDSWKLLAICQYVSSSVNMIGAGTKDPSANLTAELTIQRSTSLFTTALFTVTIACDFLRSLGWQLSLSMWIKSQDQGE